MIPILYPETETRFTSNGIGALSDVIDAEVVEQLNGTFELEMKYPLKGIHSEGLTDRNLIMVKPNPVSDPQPFRIYRINPVSKGTMMVYARHIAYDTMGIPAAPFQASSAAHAMASLKLYAATDCPFTFTTDKATEANMDSRVPKSIWKLLGGSEGSILDVYGGEYEFDRFHIRLHTRRGADRGVSIRYGKNLTTLEQDRNCANVYTGVYPYWASQDGILVQIPEKILHAEGVYSYTRIMELDLSDKFQEEPTEEQLRARAEKYMEDNSIGVPDVSWKVEFVQLEQTEEYKGTAILERVLIGDTVSVFFSDMQVNASARAVEIRFNPILERYNNVTLGKLKANLADTIVKQQQALERVQNESPMTQIIAQKLAAAMGAHGGCVRIIDTNADGEPDELYIADHPDPAEALKVWRFNYLGWAVSKTGYNGPFIMGATIEDGLLAEFVTAAHLVAGTIQSADGGFFMDLYNGIVDLGTNRLSINSTNFKLDRSGEVAITGSLTTTDGTRKANIQAGGIYFHNGSSAIAEISADKEVSGKNVLKMDMKLGGTVFSVGDTPYLVVNNGINPGGYTERVYMYNARVTEHMYIDSQLIFTNPSTQINEIAFDHSGGTLYMVASGVQVTGSFSVGGSKNRVVKTENYDTIAMNAMESANAVFSDMGSATLNEGGYAEIWLDPKFAETVDQRHEYHVFASAGKVEKFNGYFTVTGEPGDSVDWIVFYRQKDYAEDRMEYVEFKDREPEMPIDESVFYGDDAGAIQSQSLMDEFPDIYEIQAEAYLENYEQEIYGYGN